jgi:AAA domain
MSARASTWLEDVEKHPVSWAMTDYIARGVVTSINGPRNSGKTLCASWLAAAMSRDKDGAQPLRVWFNSQEDDLGSVLRPRLEAAGANLAKQVRLTGEHWKLPADLGRIKDELTQHREGDKPDDVLILDSVQQHISSPNSLPIAGAAMKGLVQIALEFNIAVILIGHTRKGKGASVESTIAGAAVLQNMAKAIYLFGPEPGSKIRAMDAAEGQDDDELPRYVLACERLGIGPMPPSLLLERRVKYDEGTKRDEAFLEYLRPCGYSAREVLDESKDDKTGRDKDATATARAALWIKETLAAKGPMLTADFEILAKGDGVYASRNTFDRARKIAGVRTGRRGKVWWVWLKEQDPPEEDDPAGSVE